MSGNGNQTVTTQRRLLRLIDAVRGRRTSLVQVHNNPDPDSIGSAVAMRDLYQRYLGIDSRIVFGGIVGRTENRMMLRLLQIEIVPATKVDYAKCDLLTLVDTQPGAGHTSLPPGRGAEVVIDHHPARDAPENVLYWDVGRNVGATSTIVANFFLENGVPLRRTVATALMYGIKSDTHDLSDEATPADIAAYQSLFSYGDLGLLAQIEKARVPRTYFRIFQRAIETAQIFDFAIVSHLGSIDNPDMVAEMADFLLRCEDVRWTMVTGIYRNTLHLSLRCADGNSHAGRIARRAVGVMGTAGGHGRMAGGQIPLGESDRSTRANVVQAVSDMFLEAVKAKRTLMQPLANRDDLEDTDTSGEIE
ncbi:MAG: bifunctional oligoribonuclease/PAP phosphatase NrnA [Planctomycetes bacterium]|nr:bifunctional oligoribonuclease/PAP phosphatase NrnA [Planctomycetota bacterium]